LNRPHERWSRFAPELRKLAGERDGFLLFTEDDELGASTSTPPPHTFDEAAQRAGWILASHAAVAFSAARTHQQLGDALETVTRSARPWASHGALRADRGQRFQVAQEGVQDHNIKLREIAAASARPARSPADRRGERAAPGTSDPRRPSKRSPTAVTSAPPLPAKKAYLSFVSWPHNPHSRRHPSLVDFSVDLTAQEGQRQAQVLAALGPDWTRWSHARRGARTTCCTPVSTRSSSACTTTWSRPGCSPARRRPCCRLTAGGPRAPRLVAVRTATTVADAYRASNGVPAPTTGAICSPTPAACSTFSARLHAVWVHESGFGATAPCGTASPAPPGPR